MRTKRADSNVRVLSEDITKGLVGNFSVVVLLLVLFVQLIFLLLLSQLKQQFLLFKQRPLLLLSADYRPDSFYLPPTGFEKGILLNFGSVSFGSY